MSTMGKRGKPGASLRAFRDFLPNAVGRDFDLVIDDGLHSPNANIAVLSFGLSRLKPGGWLVVEDIGHAALPLWEVVAHLLPMGFTAHIVISAKRIVFAVQRTA
jgi:hypothetical protein